MHSAGWAGWAGWASSSLGGVTKPGHPFALSFWHAKESVKRERERERLYIRETAVLLVHTCICLVQQLYNPGTRAKQQQPKIEQQKMKLQPARQQQPLIAHWPYLDALSQLYKQWLMQVGRFSDAPQVFFFFLFQYKIGNKTSIVTA
jgi:hypothetical protein